MQLLAILLIGYSFFSAILLIIKYTVQKQLDQPLLSNIAGLVLIICLATIQWLNLQFILGHTLTIFSSLYISVLFSIAPCFYLHSYQLLNAQTHCSYWHFLHIIPVVICFFIPLPWSVPAAFLIGSAYLLWLGRAIYLLRRQRARFKLELLALAAFFCIAIAVIVLGFIWPLINNMTFVIYYSILIGMAYFASTLTLLIFPSITTDVVEAAKATYSDSTLNNIDKTKVLEQLTHLMHEEKIYTLESLSLNILAEQLQLTSHQLSELINTEYKQGFSKFIRQYRVEHAKKLLMDEPESSILSIGLSVGFSTQSNFYNAFRDIAGIAPGQYRKQQHK